MTTTIIPAKARSLLEQANLFSELSPAGKDAIASICTTRALRKKETLFREGERGHAVYLLATGHIRLSRLAPEGREIVIKIIQPGEIFAEVILFEQVHYPVTATAATSSLVLSMPRLQIHQLLEDREFRRDFIAMLLKKQRYLADQIYALTSSTPEERFLRFLAEHYGRVERMNVTFAKKEIAAAIGATPETFSRLILRLKQAKLLRWEGHELQVRPAVWRKKIL